MSRVVAIVEGDGEVLAVPILLRRLFSWLMPDIWLDVATPIRVRRDRFLNRDEEFRRYLQLAANKCDDDGLVLILLDADDDCPATLGAHILERAKLCIPHRRLSVVLANREYEAWFLAAARSLDGHRGFRFNPNEAIEAERPRNAKLWMTEHMLGSSYQVMTDQPAFSSIMDLQMTHAGSRSFRKLCSEIQLQVSSA